ncbi:hypothetical protein [Mongoliitalea lutea]|uniref:Lipoprotein n=1 Tax=Mongoliitalea lutea TaxID=849756 RepID=A0A8J3CVX8_9BACT|nr:hypothetical protein [Mongoliitalea lutea]GHB27338.1 hypothetical protein GCM10008106_05090 [Mongoliitalea lutea]
MKKKIARICMLLFGIGVLGFSSCTNILDFEEIASCPTLRSLEVNRVWNSVDGLVRFDNDRQEFFIVARFPNDENLTVLRTCNLPASYLEDRKLIRFFGNEYIPFSEELVMEETGSARIVPFEITWIETVRR